MKNLKENQSNQSNQTTKKSTKGYQAVNRHHLTTDMVKGQLYYPLPDWARTLEISQVRVNDVSIPIKTVIIDGEVMLDISGYKGNKIDLWIDDGVKEK